MRTGSQLRHAAVFAALAATALTALFASPAFAAVKSRVVDYSQNGTALQGYLAWDDAAKGKRPGVLVVHEWWGHNAHARRAADRLARAGYVAFALDMFGKGKLASHPAEAQAFVAEAMKDASTLPGRFDAALEILKQDPHVDTARIGAIGYCFGGGVVLAMARSGADLKAVGTFHGSLATDHPAEAGKLKAKLLVQTGDADPMVNADAVAAFEKEMTAAGASYRVIHYPGAKHAFTNPDADKFGVPGLAYNADADKKSWAELLKFFKREL
jgi:dienelactone hydrolase